MQQPHCELCCWNDATVLFDDSEYSFRGRYQRPVGEGPSNFFPSHTGYNHVINPNCYNSIYVCDTCLLTRVYMCDTKAKEFLLDELKHMFLRHKVICELKMRFAVNAISDWWLPNLYDIDKHPKFILSKLTPEIKEYFSK